MSRDISLNESASSPSWSRERIGITWPNSPARSRCVPIVSSWTPRVIWRARRSPRARATAYTTRNTRPTTPSAKKRTSASEPQSLTPFGSSGASRRTKSSGWKRKTSGTKLSRGGSPVAQSRCAGSATKTRPESLAMRTRCSPSSYSTAAPFSGAPSAHPVLAGLDRRHLELVRRQDVDPGPALEVGEEPRVGRDVDEERRVTPRLHDPQHGGAGAMTRAEPSPTRTRLANGSPFHHAGSSRGAVPSSGGHAAPAQQRERGVRVHGPHRARGARRPPRPPTRRPRAGRRERRWPPRGTCP